MVSNYLHCAILLLAYCYLTGAQILEQPVRIEPRVSKSASSGVCTPETNPLLRLQITNDVEQVLNSSIVPQLYGLYSRIPASSCADIYQGYPSGYYWLNVTLSSNSYTYPNHITVLGVTMRKMIDCVPRGCLYLKGATGKTVGDDQPRIECVCGGIDLEWIKPRLCINIRRVHKYIQ